ncbi:MAG TPA: putative sugar O-methyltransferase, partial [Solirubrobacteraceae bacterium]|nr:putative sugar O-methyltransferase [Solirubrobacteraceae bacterium]
LIATNLEMLESEGIANFKRTVSNNYYNWVVHTAGDPQLKRAVANWLRHPTPGPLINRMGTADGLRMLGRPDKITLQGRERWRYKFFVGEAWEVARRNDSLGLTDRLAEPEVGNPIRIWYRGRLISQDLANSILELSFIARAGIVRSGARIAELGAGYGRLAFAFAEACPLTYCIFDIPPALAVAQWYLTAVFGEDRVVGYAPTNTFDSVAARLVPGVVALFTPDQLDTFPDDWFDGIQTISTLPEMPRSQSSRYLELFASKSSDAIFLKQWQYWRNEADDAALDESQYALPAPWQLTARRVDPLQPAFFNQLWTKAATRAS